MIKFFMPLNDFKFDRMRLLSEFFYWAKPNWSATQNYIQSFGFTTSEKYVNDDIADCSRFQGISTPDKQGIRRMPDGTLDASITKWPRVLQNSYMKEIGDTISNFLEIPEYRVRGSIYRTSNEKYIYPFHIDSHTPYRVHLALITKKDINWLFKDQFDEIEIHQPANGVPTLIDTAKIKHSLYLPPNSLRVHIWYQYYEPIKQEILEQIGGISC